MNRGAMLVGTRVGEWWQEEVVGCWIFILLNKYSYSAYYMPDTVQTVLKYQLIHASNSP